ncbi:hypothetical protein Lesp02_76930 [Lentzea sp. NBRC 105346]|nr:hypothetical protein Lesp02_76930 [Lentzea sp. NBRC 105346]
MLFLCVHNAGRSQMAMGFFRHLAGDRAVALSGGSARKWTDDTLRATDVVVTMGCGDTCPVLPGKG